MPLTDTGIGTGLTINPGHLTVLYDVLTGATSYDNIGLARFEYLNAGGIWGDNGYGIKDDSGTLLGKTVMLLKSFCLWLSLFLLLG